MANKESIEINEMFDLAYRFVVETSENVFLTGKAGTGKTTFLRYLKDTCSKNIVIAAPTGVAAINAGGVTLHSLFHLPFHPYIPTPANQNELLQKLRFTSRRLDILRKMDLLVIDEVSMVRCDTMDAIDFILRYVRRKQNLPFGGVQVLFIGDLFQLPPVARREDWEVLQEYYSSEFFFDSLVIKENLPVLIELKKIFRQKEGNFVSLLNKVRNNNLSEEDFEELHQRYLPGFTAPKDENFITLTTHNFQADKINNNQLARLGAEAFTYHAEIAKDFPESMYPADEHLILKAGAQVMFLKNDVEKRFFNGKIGIIKHLDNEEIIVSCDGMEINVEQETWENTRYTVNRNDGKLEQEVLGIFTQFPLRLAWAITIHKSQGLTFGKVMIDAGSAFSSGQVYVALSRCTGLDGIVLLTKIPRSAILSNESVIKGQETMTPRGALAERFKGARQVYSMQLIDEIFSFSDFGQPLNMLQTGISQYNDKVNEEATPWIDKIKNDVLSLRDVALRFLNHVGEYLRQEPIVEKNIKLQQRITDAANHFIPEFTRLKDGVMGHPIGTEHREVSGVLDDYLNKIIQLLFYQLYLFEYCKSPFTIQGFLKNKINFVPPRIKLTTYDGGKRDDLAEIPNNELFIALRRWRNTICETSDLPIYMVANSKSLKEIAQYLPQTTKELMLIKGFGKAKAAKYGEDILGLVKDYCEKNGLKGRIDFLVDISKAKKKTRTPPDKKTPTNEISYNMFCEGKSVEEIAKLRGFTKDTIEGHLSYFVADGKLNIDKFVSSEILQKIKELAEVHGWSSLKTLKDNLPENVSYGNLRMVRVWLKLD